MKKFDNLTVRELLHIEDGYYKLENPIKYSIGEGETINYLSEESKLTYGDSSSCATFNNGSPAIIMPKIGDLYNVKLKFSSGIIVEWEAECLEEGQGGPFAGSPRFEFVPDMFGDVEAGSVTICNLGHGTFFNGGLDFTTSVEDAHAKYGDSISITVTGKSEPETGEISGVISLDTKTNSTDGILKVITTMSDDVSYYIDNIWQDGDTLVISSKDDGAGSGGGSSAKTYHIKFQRYHYETSGNRAFEVTSSDFSAEEFVELIKNETYPDFIVEALTKHVDESGAQTSRPDNDWRYVLKNVGFHIEKGSDQYVVYRATTYIPALDIYNGTMIFLRFDANVEPNQNPILSLEEQVIR